MILNAKQTIRHLHSLAFPLSLVFGWRAVFADASKTVSEVQQGPFAPVDLYCERLEPGFWAEPWNALTNFSFLFAGAFGFWLSGKLASRAASARWMQALSANAMIIGVGSFLFHTFANRWSQTADVVPISIFMCLYLAFALDRVLQLKRWQTVGFVVLFFISGLVAPRVGGNLLNGSVGYFPAWMALAIVGHFTKTKDWRVAKLFLAAMGVFALSLGFRVIDLSLCGRLPLGTHFLWHTFNGLLIAILLYAGYVNEARRQAS